jgi:poly(3-hydroxybutyrate) depolymerase
MQRGTKKPDQKQQHGSPTKENGKGQQDENYVKIIAALDRITDQLKTYQKQETGDEQKKTKREIVTIILHADIASITHDFPS